MWANGWLAQLPFLQRVVEAPMARTCSVLMGIHTLQRSTQLWASRLRTKFYIGRCIGTRSATEAWSNCFASMKMQPQWITQRLFEQLLGRSPMRRSYQAWGA